MWNARLSIKIAFEICANYGMNDKIGPVSYGGSKGQQEQFQKPFSEQTGQMLDAEVRKIITYAAFITFMVDYVTRD